MYQSDYETDARIRSFRERTRDPVHGLTGTITNTDGSAGAGKRMMAGLVSRLREKLSGGRRQQVSNLQGPAPAK